mgnify:CR=1 FL=1
MSDSHSHEDIKKHVRVYIAVFIALLVGTLVTVGMYYVHLPAVWLTIAVALFIASIKASLVAGFFMHLISEKKAIYAILASTVFFFLGMMTLIILAYFDVPFVKGLLTH